MLDSRIDPERSFFTKVFIPPVFPRFCAGTWSGWRRRPRDMWGSGAKALRLIRRNLDLDYSVYFVLDKSRQ
jgi:hypothetical protein